MPQALRVVQRNALVYRRVWRGSVFFSFLQPTLYLLAMGVGLGAMVDRGGAVLPGGLPFLTFLGPGLLAAACMQTATFESGYPILGKMTWQRNYEALNATPMRIVDIVLGELTWIALRLFTVAAAFTAVLAAFGVVTDARALVAVPAAVLTGLAFSAPIMAYAATLRNGANFNVLWRFIITPLFLFSGVFFPVGRLPHPLQAVAAFTPLYHGVQLVRRPDRAPGAGRRAAAPRACTSWRSSVPALSPRWGRSAAGCRHDRMNLASQLSHPLASTVPSPRRSWRMVQRNSIVYRHEWMTIFSGFFEPLFYLLSLGIGLGALVPDVNGLNYTAFVAPGLLAASCMNGAITDGFFNIFFKLHYQKTYDGILATPMRVPDVAFGELLWALGRGSLYAATFLVVVFGLGELRGPRMLLSASALLAFPAAVLVSAAFSAMALCVTSFVRKIEDFDVVMGLIVMPMFLFSGTFFPVSQFPRALRWAFEFVPLYHAVELLRALTTGHVAPSLLWHVAFLLVAGAGAFTLAMRRLERALIK